MDVNLKSVNIFNSDTITLDKKINFIFGKNGTGKSTLSRTIKEQFVDKDVRIFQGIDSVVANGKLNSITLGNENVKAEKNIKKLENNIAIVNQEKEKILQKEIEVTTKLEEVNRSYQSKYNEITRFYKSSARQIKNDALHIANTSYDARDFEKEAKYAFHLSEDEKNTCKEYLKIESKKATKLICPTIDLKYFLDSTNKILAKKVEEEKKIPRFTDEQKVEFAKLGMNIHKKGDVCAFCNNRISDNTFDELETYFSASKIKESENEIEKQLNEIEKVTKLSADVEVDIKEFYTNYEDEASLLVSELYAIKREQKNFFESLKNVLEIKKSNLFSPSLPIEISIPNSFDHLDIKYNELVDKNNSEDIVRIKKFATDLLRFDLLDTYMNQFELDSQIRVLSTIKHDQKNIQDDLDCIAGKISEFDESISSIQKNIQKEVELTKSEKKLATNINKKLNIYVPFQLEHIETNAQSHKGYYRIRNKETSDQEYRDIGTLSKGEKNIIGFLYFIEKLNEKTDNPQDKIIVFDDPMDSNDDMMQYIIITEIQGLMKAIDKNKNNNILIIMTHNVHFYINIKYNRVYVDGPNKFGNEIKSDRFIRLEKKDNNINIKVIESEGKDFSTSYELLWKELYFLYENKKPNLMLNSIRRIIETFQKFNAKFDFYNDHKEAQKLFNVNSHSIDDIEAELNGKDADDLYNLMKDCFETNGYLDHFKLHWKNAKK